MNPDSCAPDQPGPEAAPPKEEEPPLPLIETMPDYPPGVERRSCAPAGRPAVKAVGAGVLRKRKASLPPDWAAKKRMIVLCILLLIANICVGTYLVLTWGQRSRRKPEPVPVRTPVQPERIIAPPPRPADVG